MTAWVLVLAGVTAGDGGMGKGAAWEPVEVAPKLGDGFQGYIRLPGGRVCKAALNGRDFSLTRPGGNGRDVTFYDCTLTASVAGRFRLTWFGNVYQGTALRGRTGVILTLRPAPLKIDPLVPVGNDLPDAIRRVADLKP
jgi:hypothetical protein